MKRRELADAKLQAARRKKKEGIRWKMGSDMWKREKKEREANGSIAEDVLGGFDAKIEEIKKELADS